MTDTGGTLLAEPTTDVAAFRAATGRFPSVMALNSPNATAAAPAAVDRGRAA
ncbi:hypothetical protein [Streptomyces sp. IMTB 2501]|uniref:hypothetical protein n=1 Tax=Streptomyces sp. IMTB 2501 TaxID=1776340 RepID=UPI0015BFEAF1|nr:hypothetical protein [Streptomyces sp. IMTB 2501]